MKKLAVGVVVGLTLGMIVSQVPCVQDVIDKGKTKLKKMMR